MRVRAKNQWGWSDFSPMLTIKAATKPSKMAGKPVTSIDSATGGVLIQWTAPYSNAEPITKYRIEIVNKAGTPVEDLVHCDGSTSVIVSNLKCVVPMDTLRTSYLLQYPDLVQVQVYAYNSYGWGPVSDRNTVGAATYDVPLAMSAPLRGSST